MRTQCPGCGEPLPDRAKRGRPATYHNATCRQRARRSRLTADITAHHLLTSLDHAATAIAAARRAVLAGQPADDPITALIAAVAAISPTTQAPPADAAATPDQPTADTDDADAAAPAPPTRHARRKRPTKPVTQNGDAEYRHVASPDVIHPKDVRTVKSDTFAIDGLYLVVAGNANNPILIGYVGRGAWRKTWEAKVVGLTSPEVGSWSTRDRAVSNLLHLGSRRIGFAINKTGG